jgi:hypothetical protein
MLNITVLAAVRDFYHSRLPAFAFKRTKLLLDLVQ